MAAVPERSAGIIFFRRRSGGTEVLLVHPGGPFWQHRNAGAWQIPKGIIAPGEVPAEAARREVAEEIGVALDDEPTPLGSVRQAGGKIVEAFVLEQDIDVREIVSGRFELEWPPGSGRMRSYPEIDAARWCTLDEARGAMLPSQRPLLDALEARLTLGLDRDPLGLKASSGDQAANGPLLRSSPAPKDEPSAAGDELPS